jgi:predicted nucleotidyltransferase
VLKIAGPVLEALKDPLIQPYFRSLSVRMALRSFLSPSDHAPQITDQPRVRPRVVSTNRAKHVILSLAVPPLSRIDISTNLFSAMFGLIDALEKVNLRPETKSKIKKMRETFAKSLKDESEREAREEAAEAKLVAKRRAEEERIARLSAAEQQKVNSPLLLLLRSFFP